MNSISSSHCANLGATPQDWQRFINEWHIGPLLLPVVANKLAPVAATSKLAASQLGKIPTLYNRLREVCGIKGWPTKMTSQSELNQWQREPDYNICARTGVLLPPPSGVALYALDCDITDADLANRVESAIERHLGTLGPIRRRGNSSKFTMVFTLPVELGIRANAER